MDRVIWYTTELLRGNDLLTAEKNKLYAQAYQNFATLGSATAVAGLLCAPTSPASLNVTVGTGSIYSQAEVDATAYAGLGIDTNTIVKQGLLTSPATLTITPPSTGGYSQVFLVEAIYNDVDAGNTVLPYYNSANPLQPFSGPSNSGSSQYTLRTGVCAIALKAGVAAPTGSQTTPSPDAGYVGLYAITVSNGQSTITSGNIVQLSTAPFFPTLPAIPADVQNNTWTYAADSGGVNAMAVSLSPPPTAYTTGMGLKVKAATSPTGACTLNVNGLGAVSVINTDGSAIFANEWPVGCILDLVYDGSHFQMISTGNTTIDTSVSFTVHGAGANFADLNVACEYLSKFRITHNGGVALNLAAGQYTYGANVIFDHPNQDRISVNGATLKAAAPSTSNFAATFPYTGTLATDRASALTNLRNIYATELVFPGSIGIYVMSGGGYITNLLLSSDRTGVFPASAITVWGVDCTLSNVSAANFGAIGISAIHGAISVGGALTVSGCVASGGALLAYGTGSILYGNSGVFVAAVSNDQYGIRSSGSSSIKSDTGFGTIYSQGNGSTGVIADNNGFLDLGFSSFIQNNASQGVYVLNGSTVVFGSSLTIQNNGAYGAYCVEGSVAALQGATFTTNTTGATFATNGSFIDATGSSNVSGHSSPVINTVGNSNSYVAN